MYDRILFIRSDMHMQLKLPIFPVGTQMITECLGIGKRDGVVTYLHCGAPTFTHIEDDYRSFRYITSKFIVQGLCRKIDSCHCFHVFYVSVKRYKKRLEECGDQSFFDKGKYNGGSRYKLLPAVVERMQAYLDAGMSTCEIARLEKVTEGSVRYSIKTGIKKRDTSAATPPFRKQSNRAHYS
jgi:hypothetical protein